MPSEFRAKWSKDIASIGKAQKTIVYVFISGFASLLIFSFQVRIWRPFMFFISCPGNLPRQDLIEKCKPQLQLVFAKTHNTGSSTLQNIIFRWGLHQGWNTSAWDNIEEKSIKDFLIYVLLVIDFPASMLDLASSPGMESDTFWHLLCQRKAMCFPTGSLFTLQWWGSRSTKLL